METNPVKAIREHCLDCCCGSSTEVKLCTVTKCALYPFRLGKNPYRTKVLSEEQKEEARKRLIIAREKRKELLEG